MAVLGLHEIEASRVGEIVPGAEFYDYADKYLTDAAKLIAPAELETVVEERIRQAAVEAFAAIGGLGMARVDFLLEGDRPYVNEINGIPGFTRISMLSQSVRGEVEGLTQAAADVDQIYGTARELTRAMDEIVWAVNPQHDSPYPSNLPGFAMQWARLIRT